MSPPGCVACAVVRSGTSRVVALDEDALAGGAAREEVLLRLMLGDGRASGLGGCHYQDNKVALISRGARSCEYGLRFYQVDPAARRALSGLECANSAVAGGLFALLDGLAEPDAGGWLGCVNRGTGQRMRLLPPPGAPARAGSWLMRFESGPASRWWLPRGRGSLPCPGRPPVPYHVLLRGNLFVLAETPPSPPAAGLVPALEAEGARVAPPGSDARLLPKVVLFETGAEEDGRARLRAACFSRGVAHRSVPGSGAMCLAGFLAWRRLASGGRAGASGGERFRVEHDAGALDVGVRWERDPEPRIVSTEFTTRAELLMRGAAPVA